MSYIELRLAALAGVFVLFAANAPAQSIIPIVLEPPVGTPVINDFTSSNATDIVITNPAYDYALFADLFGQDGANSGSGNAQAGESVGFLKITNTGSISYTGSNQPVVTRGVFVLGFGGVGGDATNTDGKDNGGAGGSTGGISLTNSGPISLLGGFSDSVYGIHAASYASEGGSVASGGNDHNGNPTFDGGVGGAGGNAGSVTIANSGAITGGSPSTPLTGDASFVGIYAQTHGGNAGTGQIGVNGGNAGAIDIANSGPISFNLQVTNSTPYGILAESIGGPGSNSYLSGHDGGTGGSGGAVSIALNQASVELFVTEDSTTLGGAGIAAIATGALGGNAYDSSHGGAGGTAGGVTGAGAPQTVVSIDNSNVITEGDNVFGVLVQFTGGQGGDGGIQQDYSDGGAGGNAGDVGISVDGSNLARISTTGDNAAAISVTTTGGTGGQGTNYDNPFLGIGRAGNGGIGGTAGNISITLQGNTDVQSTGDNSPTITAISRGGNGGAGGDIDGDLSILSVGSIGGTGGQGGNVSVVNGSGGRITSQGANSPGIFALSGGGAGGVAGTIASQGDSGQVGGAGGNSGVVTVTNQADALIATSGSGSAGIVAQSLSGSGGSGGTIDNNFGGDSGVGGAGGSTGAITVANDGGILTFGDGSAGILAQGISGAGGAAGSASAFFYAEGAIGGSSGVVNSVTVNQSSTGLVSTQGDNAHGVQLQSIAGGGGAAGASTAIVSVGGSSSSNPITADGGSVTLNGNGTILTLGEASYGVLAQSIGGGGGDAGASTGWLSIGGTGGEGGTGGSAAVNFIGGGNIATAGQLAHAVVAQSIGGGGGNAGNATSLGFEVAVGIGGSGGSGGNGGTAEVIMGNNAAITTLGSNAAGIVAQSVGGGGGSGGSSYTASGGLGFSAAVAVGGSGGSGGYGGGASVSISNIAIRTGNSNDPSNTMPVDSFGIVAQSIGGGGGFGGSASAKALAAAIPIPETDVMISASTTAAVGGKGGNGGHGGNVTTLLGTGTEIITQGQGSHGVLAQSIGGGGGAGGDSSSMAATLGYKLDPSYSVSLNLAFSAGGAGGSGGYGTNVDVVIGGTSDTTPTGPASIITYGDYANGILAQSIGGGGGNAGFGSSNTKDRGSTTTLSLGVALGASGGAGGSGGSTTVVLQPQGSITTYGSGAIGIVAQSIAGGGGASQGGSLNLGADLSIPGEDEDDGDGGDTELSGSITIGLGGKGAGAGTGGTVKVISSGTIQTFGGDATGILAQSVGGGGGLGGSAGSDASADDPVLPSTGQRSGDGSDDENDDDNDSYSANFSLALGGAGGQGGNGGFVSVQAGGSITTAGDWANAIVAQSIGGGGGKAGTAVSAGTDSTPDLNIQIATGGSGGSGGTGNEVTIELEPGSQITTQGYGAIAIIGQSIGGGGGIGADGSNSAGGSDGKAGTIAIGSSSGGSGGAGGSGDTVEISGTASIATFGEAAHAILLQSIGGGGGAGGQGATLSGSIGPASGSINVAVGGGSSSNGNGGAVTADLTLRQISTQGINAYGILAQSIGGGGGLGWTQQGTVTGYSLGGSNHAQGEGRNITITLDADPSFNGANIITQGAGSHAIVAQSIGGGGGIANYAVGTASLNTTPGERGASNGDGGAVSITVEGNVQTTGASAYGILAQSIGSGGGFTGDNGILYAGTTGVPGSSYGNSGTINITQSGSLTAAGTNSVGIFAQSASREEQSTIAVNINGAVTGGSGSQGYGVWIDGGSASNAITVGTTGSLSAASGNAINTTGNGILTVTNNGTITGNIDTENDYGQTGKIVNNGTIIAATNTEAEAARRTGNRKQASFTQTVINGDFAQSESGALAVRTDFGAGRGDQFVINGDADLAGRIVTAADSVDPFVRVPVLRVTGEITGELDGEIRGAASNIFRYGVERQGRLFFIGAVDADFSPDRFHFEQNLEAVAEHLTSAWKNRSVNFKKLFAFLDAAVPLGESTYRSYINQLSPGATFGFAARRTADMQAYSDRLFSVQGFTETSGSWARTSGQTAGQSGNLGLSDFRINYNLTEVGGQGEIADDWFVGGSLAYQYNWLFADDGFSNGHGHNVLGAVTIKHQRESWLFSGAIYGSLGFYETTRNIAIPGFQAEAEGSPNIHALGFALQAAYTHGSERLYFRPSVTLNTVYVHSDSYQENGAGILSLDVNSADGATFIATPALEVGGRFELDNGVVLHPFLNAGVSFLTNDAWEQEARFAGASSGANAFTTSIPMDDVVARVNAGVAFRVSERVRFAVQYEGEFSENVIGNGGSLSASFEF